MKLKKVLLVLGILAVLGFLFWPVFPGDRQINIKNLCLNNLKQTSLGLIIYASEYDDRFPDRDVWLDKTMPYLKNPEVFHCPVVRKEKGQYGFCFFSQMSRAALPEQGDTIPLLFESVNLTRNASGGLESMPAPGRHDGRNNIGYADGHVKGLTIK